MSVILGEGDFRYHVADNWADLPDGWTFKEPAGSASFVAESGQA
jgi:hypothetical protein